MVRSLRDCVVTTSSGLVRGCFADQVYRFRGIAYGSVTTGIGRFRPASAPIIWDGVRDATRFGPAAPQMPLPGQISAYAARHDGPWAIVAEATFAEPVEPYQDENCCSLNIWTQGLSDRAGRPVMVRIHGGGFYSGSGSWAWHDGAHLAQRGDVVVVTINHRLNVLGYLFLGDILGSDYQVGNVGQTDIVLALQWIRNNITRFGGDPGNVTVFGESGGGMKISALLAMPSAAGLFNKAILQSGVLPVLKSRDEATDEAWRFMQAAGISDDHLGKLQSMTVDALLGAQVKAGINPLPCIDETTVTCQPGHAIAAGMSAHLPLIMGSTLTEGTMVHLPDMAVISRMSEQILHQQISEVYDLENTNRLIENYRTNFPNASSGDIFLLIEAASWIRRNIWDIADFSEKRSGDTYVYVLAWMSAAVEGYVKASHGLCVPLSMDNADICGPWVADYPECQLVAEAMSEAWIAFAKTGNPSLLGEDQWPPYVDGSRMTMIFDTISKVVGNPYNERDVWRGVPSPQLVPALVWPGLIPF